MLITGKQRQDTGIQLDHSAETALPPIRHQWPLLGTGLFALEQPTKCATRL